MGQAKRRGTFEQRLAEALSRKPPERPIQPIEDPPSDEEIQRRRSNGMPAMRNMQLLAGMGGLLALSMSGLPKRKKLW